MKKLLLTTAMLMICITFSFAQAPYLFNYQSVIRDNAGELLVNSDVGIQISILNENASGSVLYQETHTGTTNSYGIINIQIGSGTPLVGSMEGINWAISNKYLKIEIDESGGTSYTHMGTVQLLSVPYSLYSNYAEKLGDENVYTPSSDTLFVVKDYNGNVVFAVFPDGAAVYVNESAKGKVGGFAVSGRSPSKAVETDILRVTVDSTRIFVSDTVSGKGKVGGFAVSGRSPSKQTGENILFVTADSTRVYVNEESTGKGKVGGFAVSGRSPSKGKVTSLLDLTKENYFIGHEAGANNTDGLYNTFFGFNSGYTNTIGVRNIFLGYNSGFSNIDGDANVFIGDSAGVYNETGWHNIFVGTHSGRDNVSGAKNICVGAMAGRGLVTGWNNMFIGELAGANNTSGNSNIFLGNYSGIRNIDGSTNIFIGKFSGYDNTVGTNNIFMGLASGNSNINGTENIFIGVESGFNNVSGDLNTCIGFRSGYSLDTANYNTFLGFWSGLNNENGALNTYLGAQAGENAVDGNLNVIVGAYAGSEGVVGDFNTFVGMRAGSKNAGSNNTILGGFAGYNNSAGNFNVFIGQASGENNNGSNNVFVGNGTGYNNDGSDNIFIGNNSGSSIIGSNKLVISNFDADSTQALIYGEFDHDYLKFNAYLDGIKFLNSWNVDSNYISEGNYMIFGDQGVSEDFIGYKSNTFYFKDSPGGGDISDPNIVVGGDVGIGVLSPSYKLDIDGDVNITGSYLVNGAKGKFADFVFEKGYKLESIEEHAAFMWKNKHLPALKSETEIKNGGSYDISERREQILEELEKAHIYIDQLNSKIKELTELNSQLMERLEAVEQKVNNE